MKSRREKFSIKGTLALRCKHCSKVKAEKEFYWFAGQNAYRPNCKECDQIKNRERYENDKVLKPKKLVLASLECEDFYQQTIRELGL